MHLANALEKVDEIRNLSAGWRDPELEDSPAHLSTPWMPLPEDLLATVRSLLLQLDAERVAMPTLIKPVAPYLGDGGVALWWRGAGVSVARAPAVLLTITLVAGTTCTVFEESAPERELHVPGHDLNTVLRVQDFLTRAVRWWAGLSP